MQKSTHGAHCWLSCDLLCPEAPSDKYYKAAKLAAALQRGEEGEPGVHYKVDEKQKSILLTEEGYEAAEDVLGVSAPFLASKAIARRGWAFEALFS